MLISFSFRSFMVMPRSGFLPWSPDIPDWQASKPSTRFKRFDPRVCSCQTVCCFFVEYVYIFWSNPPQDTSCMVDFGFDFGCKHSTLNGNIDSFYRFLCLFDTNPSAFLIASNDVRAWCSATSKIQKWLFYQGFERLNQHSDPLQIDCLAYPRCVAWPQCHLKLEPTDFHWKRTLTVWVTMYIIHYICNDIYNIYNYHNV